VSAKASVYAIKDACVRGSEIFVCSTVNVTTLNGLNNCLNSEPAMVMAPITPTLTELSVEQCSIISAAPKPEHPVKVVIRSTHARHNGPWSILGFFFVVIAIHYIPINIYFK
jgi:hypothetical protein